MFVYLGRYRTYGPNHEDKKIIWALDLSHVYIILKLMTTASYYIKVDENIALKTSIVSSIFAHNFMHISRLLNSLPFCLQSTHLLKSTITANRAKR